MNAPIDHRITLPSGLRPRVQEIGDGEPVLFLHGAESDRRQYSEFLPLLPAGLRGISYDQRDTADVGDGSAGRGEAYAMTDLADDAAAFLDALGVESAHIVGTSFGGALAQHLVLRHPSRVRSLVLVATTAASAPVRAYVARSSEVEPEYRARWALAGALSDTGQADDALVRSVAATLAERTDAQRARRMAALVGHDTLALLGGVAVPTVVVHGLDDPVIPFAAGEEIAATVPGAQLIPVLGARHALAFEHPEAVIDALRNVVDFARR